MHGNAALNKMCISPMPMFSSDFWVAGKTLGDGFGIKGVGTGAGLNLNPKVELFSFHCH
jgi:hypothetical protein